MSLRSLLILDLNMPYVDGWSVLRELAGNERTCAIPAIVVTGADVDKATLGEGDPAQAGAA